MRGVLLSIWIATVLIWAMNHRGGNIFVEVRSPDLIAVCYGDREPKCEHVQIKRNAD